MLGVVDVGGGLRDIYGAGIFDSCLDRGLRFDYGIGVSAGSANLASYVAGQRGRNYVFYTEYCFRPAYMSMKNRRRCGSYLDLNYAYGTLSAQGGENPLDYAAIRRSPMQLKVVATEAATGQAVYFDKSAMQQDDYRILMASSALPVACKPYVLDGKAYIDGGLSDPIPLERAFADGCDRVVLILTKPENTLREPKADRLPARLMQRSYPQAAQAIRQRYRVYNEQLAHAKELAAQGKVLILAPDDCCGMGTLTKNRESLEQMYQKGRRDAEKLHDWLKTEG